MIQDYYSLVLDSQSTQVAHLEEFNRHFTFTTGNFKVDNGSRSNNGIIETQRIVGKAPVASYKY